jgi:hypothetical protein
MDQTPHPIALYDDPSAEIADLARRYGRANGPVMALALKLGGKLEAQLAFLPDGLRDQLDRATARALGAAYGLAGQTPDLGQRGPLAAVIASGAAGGAGGIATSLAELPVTVTLILNAIRAAAAEAGFDPDEPAIRAECLRVFGAGSPLASDDGVNTSFLTARLSLTGPAVQNLIATVAPRLAAVLGQKLAAQAVPVLGALTGAALNAAFLSYYREIARIRFALLRLSVLHGAEPVLEAFRTAVEPPRILRA